MAAVDEQEQQDQAARKGGAPTREYVVLEQSHFEDDQQPYYVEVHKVEARNGTNALRRAFKELRAMRAKSATDSPTFDEATLVCIPAGQWRPTPVRAKKRESITVDVG